MTFSHPALPSPLRFLLVLGGFVAAILVTARILEPDLDRPPPVHDPELVARIEASRQTPLRPEAPARSQVEVDYAEGQSADWWPKGEAPVLAPLVRQDGESEDAFTERLVAAVEAGDIGPVTAEAARSRPLPPIAERVGAQPLVLRGPDGIGSYDGTRIHGASLLELGHRLSASGLVRYSPEGFPIVPHVARAWEISTGPDGEPDYRTFTFHLREGMRWSDGHPFTAEDILFWWSHEASSELLYGRVPELLVILGDSGWVEARKIRPDGTTRWVRGYLGTSPGRLREIDTPDGPRTVLSASFHEGDIRPPIPAEAPPPELDLDPYAVRFVFPRPHGLFLPLIASARGLEITGSPAHYLRPYHPEIGDPERIAAALAARQLPRATSFYWALKDVTNPEHPRIWPWIYRTYRASPPHDAIRNPYYWAVDEAGNQLPYLDRIHFVQVSRQMEDTARAAGQFSAATGMAAGEDYSMVMDSARQGRLRVLHWYRADRTFETIHPNLNRRTEFPGRPAQEREARHKHALLNDARFRRALSLAIDREEIVQGHYHGLTRPAQVAPGPESFFYHPPAFSAWTAYDPDEANRLLDQIGLTERDAEGYRTFPDGTRMVFFLNVFRPWPPMEFVVRHWSRVGVRAVLRVMDMRLYYTEKGGLLHDFAMFPGDNEHEPLIDPRTHLPSGPESNFALGFARWYAQGGMQGQLDGQDLPLGVIEPPPDHPLREAMAIYDEIRITGDRDAQKALYDRIQDIFAEHLWNVSVCTMPPMYVALNPRLRNVPEVAAFTFDFISPGNTVQELWFDTAPADSAGTRRQIRDAIVRVTPAPEVRATRVEAVPVRARAARWIRLALGIGLAGLLVLLAVRRPFVARRLLIMVPTLAVISLVIFTVIQLPEGDFLDYKIMEMEAAGEAINLREIEAIREMFHLDDSLAVRYARWLGLPWFASLRPSPSFPFLRGDPGQAGLLQGNLGRSMADYRPVNQIVGDRILLTFLISLGTILFTWAVAVPLGIYSAVRQYSFGDYLLTFLGFIGMCVPPFILALLLMFASQRWFGIEISGLFSPEYGAQAEWTAGKVLDLLQRIWIPIVVMGATGVAGMMRVMRANLLDEIRKPYVTTALAKGMRPVRLLLKYPVRLALNPFISGIGGIFPALVSGGMIVEVVLSLPTVGPLMLEALLAEDLFLAGSMLTVLSLLGVFGVLVSDLLLLWVDPRIRFQGGAR